MVIDRVFPVPHTAADRMGRLLVLVLQNGGAGGVSPAGEQEAR